MQSQWSKELISFVSLQSFHDHPLLKGWHEKSLRNLIEILVKILTGLPRPPTISTRTTIKTTTTHSFRAVREILSPTQIIWTHTCWIRSNQSPQNQQIKDDNCIEIEEKSMSDAKSGCVCCWETEKLIIVGRISVKGGLRFREGSFQLWRDCWNVTSRFQEGFRKLSISFLFREIHQLRFFSTLSTSYFI